ncbi:bifunctional phosphopantothenoylcysteine decarboxylase/phosphopantothenate--cysteine ligase CoaBC [Campylobacter sp. FMV-PI01]|uniref:Coenzyme A biosynthesis bifunctional protein CoaBC n=1 Tax=Campylobacter portucalensis TaxID=2608384 RepID=A0A6L5WIK2_9BACT|nr:bifunctional phosphopantothenoylcysteine decarboxylase/phosphopantothenate--cysteine ligase CoaBC [Campylobacter portucalensis]MSN97060.1 bifunctional phosphopantothenoylcysteine decarboxylase/phosphopantothenate--cysteine ligase CoaBC [Campylobacter portucalensis]
MLKDKKILLAVCGSVSFYKAYDILSELKKLGADVYVALSDGALKFCKKESFEALSSHKVLCSKSEDWQNGINHIEYSKVDLVVLAPASVNSINKLANGICDNVFMQTLISASNVPLIIAPAANPKMLNHFSTLNSIKILKANGATIIDPVEKILACGDVGKGGIANQSDIVYIIIRELCKDDFYVGKTVLITAGSTTEKIDDVRVISNLSSGKMGKALADVFYYLGADVLFVCSGDFRVPYKSIKFDSSFGLKSALLTQKLKKDDIIVMVAAVSDYIPNKVKGKLSKENVGDIITLRFKQNEDIIANINYEGVKKVGFKLEVDMKEALQNAKEALDNKNLDAVCLNILSNTVKFGSENTKITFVTPNNQIELKEDTKANTAFKLAELIKSI